MSDSSPDVADLIVEATQIQFANCIVIAGTALVFYDYFLTFSTEVSEIWNAKFSGAQAFFFLTRYSFMVFTVFYCASTFIQKQSETLCRVLYFNSAAFQLLPQIGLYCILTLRTYAVYQRNKLVLVVLGLTAVVALAIAVYLGLFAKPELVSSDFGSFCQENPVPPLQLASVVLSLVIDVLVFTLTFAKTIRHAMAMRKVGLGNGLSYFILRDGAMYFLAKLLIGVVGTTIFFVPASGAIVTWLGVLVGISNPLTINLINRLVLNLKRVSRLQDGSASTHGAIGSIQEPAFAANSFLGNLGAPLRMGTDDDDETEELDIDDETDSAKERGIADHDGIIEEPRNHLIV